MTTITTTKDPAQVWAEKLWKKAHSSLFNFQKVIIEIIDSKAWEPLGYGSFAAAWIDKMSDIKMTVEIRPHVVYQMLSEGMASNEIAIVVGDVAADSVDWLDQQRDHGVPPDKATTRRPHPRRKKLPYDTLFIKLNSATAAKIKRVDNWQEIAQAAIEAAFTGLI